MEFQFMFICGVIIVATIFWCIYWGTFFEKQSKEIKDVCEGWRKALKELKETLMKIKKEQ